MSDDDFMMDSDDDNGSGEEYDFEYESGSDENGDGSDDGEVDLENKYYSAKELKEENVDAAIAAFKGLLDKEEERGEWGFKALKQMMKLHFRRDEFDLFLSW